MVGSFSSWLATVVVFGVAVITDARCVNGTDREVLPEFASKPRYFLMTDILNEPDDEMSLVRYLLYTDQVETRGLCATTSATLPNSTHPEAIEKIVNAYGVVVDNLNSHAHPSSQFPQTDELLALITSGPKSYGQVALDEDISDGARMLIERLGESEEPLHVGIWGGANTLAQALHYIEISRSASDAATLRARLRVYSISDQDDSGVWIRRKWPEIFHIFVVHGFREYGVGTWSGIWSDGDGAADRTKVVDSWLSPNIRVGPLGEVYPLIEFNMEGDTASFLWLVQNGLHIQERPDWGGWGGRYTRILQPPDWNMYSSSWDRVGTSVAGASHSSSQATIWRWRDAYQDDFAARMGWTLSKDFRSSAHPPVVIVNGLGGFDVLHVQVPFNTSVTLDASETVDTDNPHDNSQLEFQWYFYQDASFPLANEFFLPLFSIQPLSPPQGTNGILELNEAGFFNVTTGILVSLTSYVPPGQPMLDGVQWHIVLQVRNLKGPHPITRYRRIIVTS